MQTNLPIDVPHCIALHLEPNYVIPLLQVRDEKDPRIEILKKRLLLVFEEREIKVVNTKDEKDDKLFFYHDDFYGLPILVESPKLNNLPVMRNEAA